MKKTTIIMLLVLGAFSLKAQDIAPLVTEGKQWNVLRSLEGPSPTPQHRTTTIYMIHGDTLLNGINYNKLFGTIHEDLSNQQLAGALRETETKQIFYCKYRTTNQTFENETLLYDFSLQPGDSFCRYSTDCLRVLRVNDTILEGENIPRKKYVLQYEKNGDPWYVYETWIEGIGSEYGLLGSGSRFLSGGTYDLLCYYEDDGLIWQNPLFNSCYIGTDGLDEYTPESSASVYPNPAKEKVSIEGCEVFEVMIYNGLGQLVKILKQTNEVSVSDLPEGLYVLRITDMEGLSVTKRVTVIR